jgi:hypothetical protein
MKMNKIGLAFVLGFGISACGAGTTTTPDAGLAMDTAPATKLDTAAPVAVYDMVSIVDMETTRDLFVCSATNGPGSDIDAVALIRGAATIGYGLIGSAKFTVADPATSMACVEGKCSGATGDCKYSSVSGKFTQANLVARTEGKFDAVVNSDTDDVGYFSLNGGALQIQIGDQTGAGLPQSILAADKIKVFEVDKTYATATNGCVCTPEHYAVYIQDSTGVGADILLTASEYNAANSAVCNAAPGVGDYGCGTTTFLVP